MTTKTTYTFDTGLSAGTPLIAYIDPNNHLLGTTNTGSTFYAGTPTPPPTGMITLPPPATSTAATPAGAGPGWLQGDFNVGGSNIPKIAIYGGAAAVVLLLLIK